nr:flagellar protein FlgN [Pseudomonas insulae]
MQAVEQDLQQDCSDYLGLRGLMQELYQHLLKRDSERIDLLNQQISELVDQVRVRAGRRSKILAAFKLAPGGGAMQQLLTLFPEARRDYLQETWQQLGLLAGQCKRLNERNGKLLAMHHEILSQLLGEAESQHLYAPQHY